MGSLKDALDVSMGGCVKFRHLDEMKWVGCNLSSLAITKRTELTFRHAVIAQAGLLHLLAIAPDRAGIQLRF